MGYLLAAIGGALGALARWAAAEAVPVVPGGWPWATFTVNLAGCLMIGALLGVLAARQPEAAWPRTFLGTGVLGGFTTFSAFAVETVDLARGGDVLLAGGYVVASVAGGVLAVVAGLRAAHLLVGTDR